MKNRLSLPAAVTVMQPLLSRGASRQRAKLNLDIALRFDGLAIQQCGLIPPLANRLHDGPNKVRGAVEWSNALDIPILGDIGSNSNRITRNKLDVCGLWINA